MNLFPRYPIAIRRGPMTGVARRSSPSQAHLKCASCDYDLYSLPTDGQCPECGHPILESRQHAEHKAANRSKHETFAGMMWAYTTMLLAVNVLAIFNQNLYFGCFFYVLLIVGGVFSGFVVFIGVITRLWEAPEFVAAAVLCAVACLMFGGNLMWLETAMP